MVVRMRHTRAHTRNRRSHHALSGERLSTEKGSGAVHPRHKALLDGTPYRGRTVMDTSKKGNALPATSKKTASPAAQKTKETLKKKK